MSEPRTYAGRALVSWFIQTAQAVPTGTHAVEFRRQLAVVEDAARAALLAELRAKVEALNGTIVLDGRGIGQVHEPTRAAVLALLDDPS